MLFSSVLEQASDAFSRAITDLPPPLDHEVGVTYLLMRLADAFEDCAHVPTERRVDGLRAFCELMRAPTDPIALDRLRSAAAAVASACPGEGALFDGCALLFDAFALLRPPARALIAEACIRMAEGMIHWIYRTDDDGVLRAGTLTEVRAYCCAMAGVVGPLLTELFLIDRPELVDVSDGLRQRARAFGVGVQMLDVARGVARVDVVETVPIDVILAVARTKMGIARRYVQLVESAGAVEIARFVRLTFDLAIGLLEVTDMAHDASSAIRTRRRTTRPGDQSQVASMA